MDLKQLEDVCLVPLIISYAHLFWLPIEFTRLEIDGTSAGRTGHNPRSIVAFPTTDGTFGHHPSELTAYNRCDIAYA